MKNVVMTAVVTAVLVIGIALGVGEWASGKANQVFDAKDAEIVRLENEADGHRDRYWASYEKWDAQVGRLKKSIKLFTDDWNAQVKRLSDEKAALKSDVDKWEACAVVLAEKLNTPDPTPEPTPEPEPTFTDRVQESTKGVVLIQTPSQQGSGFAISERLIVTAGHCVEGKEDFTITTHDGHKIKATRAISDKEHDVAFIRVDDLTCVEGDRDGITCSKTEHEVKLNPLTLGSIEDCRLGQNVYVIGSPHGKLNFNSLTTGIISGVNRDWSPLGADYGWEVAFTVDSAGHPGNSGCPVFTMDGAVRGILVGGFSPVLVSVMPCDLFLGDLDSIRLMFAQDRYEREEAESQNGDWYNGLSEVWLRTGGGK